MEQKKETTHPKETLTVPEDVDKPAYDGDEEPDFYFPQFMHDGSYPTITIVKEVPYLLEDGGGSYESTLNPRAQPFEPSGEGKDPGRQVEYLQVDEETKEVESLSEKEETILPGNTLGDVRNSPVHRVDLDIGDVNTECSEELIGHGTEPVEEDGDGMRKEGTVSEMLIEDKVEKNESTPIQEEPEPRRSTRIREQPDRLTYKSLGNPLVLVIQSLFSGLNKAFTQALERGEFPEVRTLTPDRSMIL